MSLSLEEGRSYEAPQEVEDLPSLYKEIEALTLDHRYRYLNKDAPYHGILNNIEALGEKLQSLFLQGFIPSGLTIHCGSSIFVRDQNARAKVISIYFEGSYLDFILGLYSDDSSAFISENEILPIVDMVNLYTDNKIRRRGKDSYFWLSF